MMNVNNAEVFIMSPLVIIIAAFALCLLHFIQRLFGIIDRWRSSYLVCSKHLNKLEKINNEVLDWFDELSGVLTGGEHINYAEWYARGFLQIEELKECLKEGKPPTLEAS